MDIETNTGKPDSTQQLNRESGNVDVVPVDCVNVTVNASWVGWMSKIITVVMYTVIIIVVL